MHAVLHIDCTGVPLVLAYTCAFGYMVGCAEIVGERGVCRGYYCLYGIIEGRSTYIISF